MVAVSDGFREFLILYASFGTRKIIGKKKILTKMISHVWFENIKENLLCCSCGIGWFSCFVWNSENYRERKKIIKKNDFSCLG